MTQTNKTVKRTVLLLALLLMCVSLVGINVAYVYAGVSTVVVCDESGYSQGLAGDVWHTDNDDKCVAAAGESISFTAKMANSAATYNVKANNLKAYEVEECFRIGAVITLTEMPSNARFGFLFGLTSSGHKSLQSGSMLWFEKGKWGISKYESRNNTRELFTANADIDLNAPFTVEIVVSNEGVATVTVGSAQSQNVQDVSTEGYMGIGCVSGVSGLISKSYAKATVRDLHIVTYSYDTPENVECYESFDYGYFNQNAFTTMSKAGVLPNSGLTVQNKALTFANTGDAILSTMREYSNVEFAFDMPAVQTEAVYEDGVLVKSVSAPISVAFGAKEKDKVSQSSPLMIRFKSDSASPIVKGDHTVAQLMNGKDVIDEIILPDKYDMYAGKAVSVRVVMVDGVVRVGIKTTTENGFAEIFARNMGFTPKGYVQIMSAYAMNAADVGSARPETVWQGSFTVDNLSVINRDVGKNVVQVEYVSNLTYVPGDYVYEDTWDENDLLSAKV